MSCSLPRHHILCKLAILLPLTVLTACATPSTGGLLGAYRFADGRLVSIRPSVDQTLRYREYASGRSGRLYRESGQRFVSGTGFSAREPVVLSVEFDAHDNGTAGRLRWSSDGLPPKIAERVGRDEWIEFESDGTRLHGRVHVPAGRGPFPAIVLVHGSGKDPGSLWLYNGDFLAAHGFAVLAYDKRGSGRSGGRFTFGFHQLARDAAAAVGYLRSREDIDAARIGLSGYSQGAWVAPLAASLDGGVRFVLASYGMIESPAEEARLEMLQLLKDARVSEQDLADADGLIRAAIAVVASGFREGWQELDAQKTAHDKARWRVHLEGTPVAQLTDYPKWLLRIVGPVKSPHALDWHYDSTALLETLGIPMVWFLGGQDRNAPNGQTIDKLLAWREAGKPVELVLFPEADHGMLQFEQRDGRRLYTRYSPTYHRAEVAAALRLVQP